MCIFAPSFRTTVFFLFAVSIAACSISQNKKLSQSILVNKSHEIVKSEIINYLAFRRARMERVEKNYIQVFFYSNTEGLFHDHGHRVTIWLSEQDEGVRVYVSSSSVGMIWRSTKYEMILSELKIRLTAEKEEKKELGPDMSVL